MGRVKREYAHRAIVVPPLQCGEIHQEIEILYGKMVVEIINLLCPFLGFAKTFFLDKTHNMVALMLDPHFKSMDCIMDYIGRDQVVTLVQQYDDLTMMPMLKAVMGFLNLGQTTSLNPPPLEQPLISCGLFKAVASIQEAIEGLFKAELFCFLDSMWKI